MLERQHCCLGDWNKLQQFVFFEPQLNFSNGRFFHALMSPCVFSVLISQFHLWNIQNMTYSMQQVLCWYQLFFFSNHPEHSGSVNHWSRNLCLYDSFLLVLVDFFFGLNLPLFLWAPSFEVEEVDFLLILLLASWLQTLSVSKISTSESQDRATDSDTLFDTAARAVLLSACNISSPTSAYSSVRISARSVAHSEAEALSLFDVSLSSSTSIVRISVLIIDSEIGGWDEELVAFLVTQLRRELIFHSLLWSKNN